MHEKLNPKIFDADVEQVPIRKGFGEGILKAAEMVDFVLIGLIESGRYDQ